MSDMATLRCRCSAIALGRATGVPGLNSVTSERAPVRSTSAAIRLSEQTCSLGMRSPASGVEFGESGEKPRLRLLRPPRLEITGDVGARNSRRAEEFPSLAVREAGQLRRF